MLVKVERNGVPYFCKSEEQLKNFLDAGYAVVDEAKKAESTPEAKATTKKRTTKSKS